MISTSDLMNKMSGQKTKTGAKTRKLTKADVNKVLKEIGFDPKDPRFKFLMEVDALGDFNYFLIRAAEELSGHPVERQQVIKACRLLILYLNSN